MSSPELTLATLCDRRFAWGAFLLAASIRRSGLRHPILFHLTDSDSQTAAWLEQFDGTRVVLLDPKQDSKNPILRKPEVMLSVETEFAAWIDSDCLIVGDVSRSLIPPNGRFQIRYCSDAENRFLFGTKCGNRYGPGDNGTGIPQKVLEIWRRDVGENQNCAIRTLAQADTIIVHRSHFDFIRRWQDQMNLVTPHFDRERTIDPESIAYFMADMSVLNSLLAFSRLAPPSGDYLLNNNPQGFICHFGARPKPWDQWTVRTFRYFEEIAANIDWAKDRGYRTPPIPWHFQRRFKNLALLRAYARAAAFRIANACGGGRSTLPEA